MELNPLESLLTNYVNDIKVSTPIVSIDGGVHQSRDGIYATIKMIVHHNKKNVLIHTWQLTVINSGNLRCEMSQSVGKQHLQILDENKILDALQISKLLDQNFMDRVIFEVRNIFEAVSGGPQTYFKDFL